MNFTQIKEEVQKAQRDKDKAEGALEQIMKDLDDKFDCNNLNEAEKLLKEFEEKEKGAYKKYEKAKAVFQEEWNERLDEG